MLEPTTSHSYLKLSMTRTSQLSVLFKLIIVLYNYTWCLEIIWRVIKIEEIEQTAFNKCGNTQSKIFLPSLCPCLLPHVETKLLSQFEKYIKVKIINSFTHLQSNLMSFPLSVTLTIRTLVLRQDCAIKFMGKKWKAKSWTNICLGPI